MNTVYLDNSATTPLCEAAKEAIREAMDNYGNPSSLHSEGLRAEAILKNARKQVLTALGVRNPAPEQLIFTACGTESNNTAILGVAYAKARREANRIITTDSEHPSVENAMQKLQQDGFEVIRIPTRGGVLDTEAAIAALGENALNLIASEADHRCGAGLFEMQIHPAEPVRRSDLNQRAQDPRPQGRRRALYRPCPAQGQADRSLSDRRRSGGRYAIGYRKHDRHCRLWCGGS